MRQRGKGPEAITLVERAGAVMLCVDDDGVDGNRRACAGDPADRVKQQGFAKPAPLATAIDRQAPDHGCRTG